MIRECQSEKVPNTRKQVKSAREREKGKRMVSMLGKKGWMMCRVIKVKEKRGENARRGKRDESGERERK
jgi:hypothetical protein